MEKLDFEGAAYVWQENDHKDFTWKPTFRPSDLEIILRARN